MVNWCVMCKRDGESVIHLFGNCDATVELYEKVATIMRIQPHELQSKEALNKGCKPEVRSLIVITQFVIWRERCSRIFTDASRTMDQLALEIKQQMEFTNSMRL